MHDAVTVASAGQMMEGNGEKEREGESKGKKKSLEILLGNAFVSFLFFHLCTSSVAVSQLFDIFPEENVLCFNEPVAS